MGLAEYPRPSNELGRTRSAPLRDRLLAKQLVHLHPQRACNPLQRSNASGLFAGFDFGQIGACNARPFRKHTETHSPMSTPNADRMLAGTPAPVQLDGQPIIF